MVNHMASKGVQIARVLHVQPQRLPVRFVIIVGLVVSLHLPGSVEAIGSPLDNSEDISAGQQFASAAPTSSHCMMSIPTPALLPPSLQRAFPPATTPGSERMCTAPVVDRSSPQDPSLPAASGTDTCQVDPGFNDACPQLVTVPDGPHGDPANVGTLIPRHILASRDGQTVYVNSLERDADAKATFRSIITAYSTDTGRVLWRQKMEAAPHLAGFQPGDMALSPDGSRIYLDGYEYGVGTLAGYAAALDAADGELVWQRELAPLLPASLKPYIAAAGGGLAVSGDGAQIYLAASVEETNGRTRPWFMALDADTGELVWTRSYGSPPWAERASMNFYNSSSLALTPDGSQILATVNLYGFDANNGQGPSRLNNKGFATVSLDADTGEVTWADEFEFPSWEQSFQNPVVGLSISPNGSAVFVAYNPARMAFGVVQNMAVNAYDRSTGQRRWVQEYHQANWLPETGCATPNWVSPYTDNQLQASASNEHVYLLGSVGTLTGGCSHLARQVGVLALDTSSGEPEWTTTYGDTELGYTAGCPWCQQLTVASESIFVTGEFYPSDGNNGCGVRVQDVDLQVNRPGLCIPYGLTAQLDARTGDVQGQYRWIDTYYDDHLNPNRPLTRIDQTTGAAISPDGTRLHVVHRETSEPREWHQAIQVRSYHVAGSAG